MSLDLSNAVVVGYFDLPSPQMAESNPDAYNRAWQNAPKGCGLCAHCGTGILHHVVVRVDGRDHFIGSQCADRVGSESVRRAVKARKTTEQLNAEQAALDARIADYNARKARLESLRQAMMQARVARYKHVLEAVGVAVQIVDGKVALAQGTAGSFHYDLCKDLIRIGVSQNQSFYLLKAVYGRCTKKNEAAWYALEDELLESRGMDAEYIAEYNKQQEAHLES